MLGVVLLLAIIAFQLMNINESIKKIAAAISKEPSP